MPTIGFDTTTGFGAATRPDTDPHFAQVHASAMFSPSDAQEVFEVGYHADGAGSFEVGVYRNDTDAKVISATVTATGAGRAVASVTPTALTQGVDHYVAWRVVTNNSTIYINSVGLDRGERDDTVTGANALKNTWSSSGAALQTEFAVFATTRAASGGTVNTQTLTDTLVATDQGLLSVIRGAVLTDSIVLQDFISWWWYRTRTLEDSIVVTEGPTETYTQYNAQMTDELMVSDELIWWLRRNRMLQDDVAITDELISNVIGYLIFVSVLTSNVTVTDQADGVTFFNRMLDSNLLTTDQALRALWVSRELMDAVSIDDDIGSSVQRFILLTDAISVEDSLTAIYIPETTVNPLIRIGFDQPEVKLGGYSVN